MLCHKPRGLLARRFVCMNKMKLIRALIAGFLCLKGTSSTAQQTIHKKPFTVADEIGLRLFAVWEPMVQFSPDGNYFAVHSERGRLDLNRPEGTLRFYRRLDIDDSLKQSDSSEPPSPIWEVNRAPDKRAQDTLVIEGWRWLADSSGVAFLERTAGGNRRLVLADLGKKTIWPLTSAKEVVNAFDVRDRNHYVYSVVDQNELEKLKEKTKAERLSPATVGTGRRFMELVIPDDPTTARIASPPSKLWAVVGVKPFEVKHDGEPIVLMPNQSLALSPNGKSLVTIFPISDVTSSWERLYPAPYTTDPIRRQLPLRHVTHQYV